MAPVIWLVRRKRLLGSAPHAIPFPPAARAPRAALQALPRRRRPRQRRDRHRELPQHRLDAGAHGARLDRVAVAQRQPDAQVRAHLGDGGSRPRRRPRRSSASTPATPTGSSPRRSRRAASRRSPAIESLRREVKYGEASRIDILLEDAKKGRCYVEVKNVHLMRAPGLAEFPDCVTARGAKHLRELAAMVAQGHRAVMLFLDPAHRRQALHARARSRPGLLRGVRRRPSPPASRRWPSAAA